MRKKKTHEEFVKQVFDLVGDEYIVLGDYVKTSKPLMMKHIICGFEYPVRPNDFLKKDRPRRCPKCAGKVRKDTDYFKNEMFDIVGNEYILLSEYKNDATKVKMKHDICGFEYKVVPNAFLRGQRCPKCSGLMRKTTDEFKKDIFELHGDKYSLIGEYKNIRTKVRIKHNICGHEWTVTPNNFLNGVNCPRCSNKVRDKNTEYFQKEVDEIYDNSLRILGDYKNNREKIEVKHLTCGSVYFQKPLSLLFGHLGCPNCKIVSKGEEKIEEFLKQNNIKYDKQFTFDDCKNKAVLPFDFAIINEFNNTDFLIEYDGRQHFEPIELWGGEENLKYTQKNDEIKNNYCKENNIPLIRIPYWEFDNVENILSCKLNIS